MKPLYLALFLLVGSVAFGQTPCVQRATCPVSDSGQESQPCVDDPDGDYIKTARPGYSTVYTFAPIKSTVFAAPKPDQTMTVNCPEWHTETCDPDHLLPDLTAPKPEPPLEPEIFLRFPHGTHLVSCRDPEPDKYCFSSVTAPNASSKKP